MPSKIFYVLSQEHQSINIPDSQQHLLASAIFSFLLMWLIKHEKKVISHSLKLLALIALFFGGCVVELIQENFIQGRDFDYHDIYMNGTGIVIGAFFYAACRFALMILIYSVKLGRTKSGKVVLVISYGVLSLFAYIVYDRSYERDISQYIRKQTTRTPKKKPRTSSQSAFTKKVMRIIEQEKKRDSLRTIEQDVQDKIEDKSKISESRIEQQPVVSSEETSAK